MMRAEKMACSTVPVQPARSQRGFALLIVFLMAAAVAFTLYQQLPRVAFESERDKEELLIERGEQYKRAIQLYVIANKRYPSKIEDLENTNQKRYLRRRYIDPMTGKNEWRLVHVNAGGVLTDSLVQKPPAAAAGQGNQVAGNPGGAIGAPGGLPNSGLSNTGLSNNGPAPNAGLASNAAPNAGTNFNPAVPIPDPNNPGSAQRQVNPAVLQRPSDRLFNSNPLPPVQQADFPPDDPSRWPAITLASPTPIQGAQGPNGNGGAAQPFGSQPQPFGQPGGQPGNPQFQQQFPGQAGNPQFNQQFPGQPGNPQFQQQFPGQQFPNQLPNQPFQPQQFPGAPTAQPFSPGAFNGQQFPGQTAQSFPGQTAPGQQPQAQPFQAQPQAQPFQAQPFQGQAGLQPQDQTFGDQNTQQPNQFQNGVQPGVAPGVAPASVPFPGQPGFNPQNPAQNQVRIGPNGQFVPVSNLPPQAANAQAGLQPTQAQPTQAQPTGGAPSGTPNPGANPALQMINDILTRPGQNPVNAGGNNAVGAGIAGVASTFEGPSIKVYRERSKYNEWEFIFDFKSTQRAPVAQQQGSLNNPNQSANPITGLNQSNPGSAQTSPTSSNGNPLGLNPNIFAPTTQGPGQSPGQP